jgi:hypothetical protein
VIVECHGYFGPVAQPGEIRQVLKVGKAFGRDKREQRSSIVRTAGSDDPGRAGVVRRLSRRVRSFAARQADDKRAAWARQAARSIVPPCTDVRMQERPRRPGPPTTSWWPVSPAISGVTGAPPSPVALVRRVRGRVASAPPGRGRDLPTHRCQVRPGRRGGAWPATGHGRLVRRTAASSYLPQRPARLEE